MIKRMPAHTSESKWRRWLNWNRCLANWNELIISLTLFLSGFFFFSFFVFMKMARHFLWFFYRIIAWCDSNKIESINFSFHLLKWPVIARTAPINLDKCVCIIGWWAFLIFLFLVSALLSDQFVGLTAAHRLFLLLLLLFS